MEWVSDELKQKLLTLVRELGTYQMNMRGTSVHTKNKVDSSPVTEVDIYCHKKIKALLESETPDVFLLSEESSDKRDFDIHNSANFWCVDPLDGTRDYLDSSDHFAINLALFSNGSVQWGLIHHPASHETMIANRYTGKVFFVDSNNVATFAHSPMRTKNIKTVITSARVAMDAGKKKQITAFAPHLHEDATILPISSSYKFFLLIKGEAQAYVRKAPCMSWDIAPGFLAAELCGMKNINLVTESTFEWPHSSLAIIPSFAIFVPSSD